MVDYYSILQISSNANTDEVKKAYRRLAYEYHPDVSSLPNAREKFIEINEAYEYITNKLKLEADLRKAHNIDYDETAQSVIDAWILQERERIRARARKYANMRYKNFTRTKEYKATAVLSNILSFAAFLLGLSVVIGSVYGTYSRWLQNPLFVDSQYIVSSFFVFFIGVIMTGFAIYSILKGFKLKRQSQPTN